MKRNRINNRVAASLALGGLCLSLLLSSARAETLSDGQIAALEEKLATLKMAIENRHSQMNASAGDIFLNASQNPAEAVALYLNCHRIVDFEREGREAREFDDWKDAQRDRVKDPRFLEGLQTQLRWLALSCKAAEAENLDQVFPGLLSYADGLMRLTEMPGQTLLEDVSGSIFAEAYGLKKLLSRNENWEMVPFNIGGIYEKTVLPHLRENGVEKLMGAWDRRIAQQTQLVEFFESLENRGNRKDDRRRAETEVRQMQGGRTGGIVKAHDKDDFLRDTLPGLKMGKLIDMYRYVDQAQGAAGLIAFIEENIEHERAAEWLDGITRIFSEPTETTQPTAATPRTPVITSGNTVPSTPSAPAGGSSPPSPGAGTTSGKVPPGLVPAN